jgi:hypothetical protein
MASVSFDLEVYATSRRWDLKIASPASNTRGTGADPTAPTTRPALLTSPLRASWVSGVMARD